MFGNSISFVFCLFFSAKLALFERIGFYKFEISFDTIYRVVKIYLGIEYDTYNIVSLAYKKQNEYFSNSF